LTDKSLIFGKIVIPISEQHRQTGSYISSTNKTTLENMDIKFYPPTYGNPLLEEAPSKNYTFKSSDVKPSSEK